MGSEGRPRFEVADVVREHGDDYRRAHCPSAAQEAVLNHIAECRTAALGGHLEQCDSCGHQRISYNSCRDRHCPKCQNTARAEWITERLERLLPVPYFHLVFTIPDDLNPLALRNRKVVFDILFAAAAQTLLAIARDGKHLGGQVGFTAVLHTWGQNLLFHPHLHCVVTGGWQVCPAAHPVSLLAGSGTEVQPCGLGPVHPVGLAQNPPMQVSCAVQSWLVMQVVADGRIPI